MNDLVSIIVPTYNCRDYLREFMNSVISQTYGNWELIIVDDGSVDGTSEMITSTFRDERIFYYNRPEKTAKGAPSCRNYGKRMARGEFICFFDADDLISSTCIEKRLAYIKNTDADYCIFPSGVFTGDPNSAKKTHVGVKSGIDILTSLLNNYYQHCVWTNIYRALAVKDIWWDEHVSTYEDLYFLIQCFLKGLSFEFSDEDRTPDYLYRIGQSRTTMSTRFVDDEKLTSTIYLFNEILHGLGTFSNDAEYRKDFIQYHLWYYSLIIREGNAIQEKKFLTHVESVYGKRASSCFRATRPLSSLIAHKRLRRLAIMLCFYIMFRPSRIGDMYKIFKVLLKIKL